jgi:hypothetical protein
MSLTLATLNGNSLPPQFSYKPATPSKRQRLVQTVNSVVKQIGEIIVPQDTLLSWTCDAACLEEWKTIFDLFNDNSDSTLTFVGYWGDSYVVKFHELDAPTVRAGWFSFSGSFQIITVTSWHST